MRSPGKGYFVRREHIGFVHQVASLPFKLAGLRPLELVPVQLSVLSRRRHLENPDLPARSPAPESDSPGAAGVKRQLFFGLAMLLAFGSMFAGVLNWGKVLQYGLAIAAAIVALVALTMTASNPQPPPK